MILHPDYTTIVLSQLMETDKIPKAETALIGVNLVGFLAGHKFSPIKADTREESLKILINLGIINKKLSGQAISVLAKLINRDSEILNPYLNKQNKNQLLLNLNSLSNKRRSQDERRNFEKILRNN